MSRITGFIYSGFNDFGPATGGRPSVQPNLEAVLLIQAGETQVSEELSVLCPNCLSSNPDDNRFCGKCGSALPVRSEAKGAPRRDELPKELIEFDRKIPLIAQPGTDRRNTVPENIREKVHEVVERDRRREAEQKYSLVHPTDENREVRLPASFLGLETTANDVVREPEKQVRQESVPVATIPEPVAPASVTPTEPAPKTQGSGGFLNLDYSPTVKSSGGVSGPSFLGLGDDVEEIEDEPVSHTRRNVALVILLLLIGLGATQWSEIRNQALPFVKNGTQKVMLRVKGKIVDPTASNAPNTQPPADQNVSANGTSNTANPNGPNMEVAPLNSNAKKPDQPADGSAANASGQPSATPGDSAPTAATPSEVAKAANPAAEDAAAKNDESSTTPTDKAAKGKAAAAKTEDTAAADEPAEPAAKEPAKKSADTASRRNRKPSGLDRPQIANDEPVAGRAEYAQALAASDPKTQSTLLWQSVKKGNPDASVKLAEMYIAGSGVEKNCDQATILLRSASAHNSARARGKLGAMYATGECVPQDRVQAYHWMSMALQANPASSWTAQYRDNLWSQMNASERSQAGRDR